VSDGLLVSCGEASGDTVVASVLEALGGGREAFGMAGQGGRAAGVQVCADADRMAVMGLLDAAAAAARVVGAYRALQAEVVRRRPRAALLVGFTEFNQRLGAWLRQRSVHVLWCGAPQVWAWRKSRLRSLRASMDALAVMLPFEQVLWQEAGYQVRYVGHPCLDSTRMGAAGEGRRLAVLCGSRAKEVTRTGRMLLQAAGRWTALHPGWQADALAAPALPAASLEMLERAAERYGVRVVRAPRGAAPLLHGYALAMCVSGTASLEAAVSGAVPVVAYRFDPLTSWVGRAVVRAPHVALANMVLGERAFPELVLAEATAERVLQEAERVCDDLERRRQACRRVRERMELGDGRRFGERVAELLGSG
jgi:lipid-A-disaccharide synthase